MRIAAPYLIAGCCCAVLLTLALWPRNQAPSALGTLVAAPPASDHDHAPDSHSGAAHAAMHQQQDALVSALPQAERQDPFADRYRAPNLLNPARFAPLRSPLRSDPSCANNATLQGLQTAEEGLRTRYGIDAAERYPQDYFFRTLTQFLTLGAEHYQIAAVWDLGMPPVYRIDLFVSPSADFSREVLQVDPPLPRPPRLDAVAATEYVAALTQLYLQQGAALGQRSIEADVLADDGTTRVDLKLSDAKVTSWSFDGGLCEAVRDASHLNCRCLPGDELAQQ